MAFKPAPLPRTALGYHRILSPNAGLRVSPLCLGAMSIGDAWSDNMGSMTKEQSFKLLDAFYEAGGNFIDTANIYQEGQSEEWLGEWISGLESAPNTRRRGTTPRCWKSNPSSTMDWFHSSDSVPSFVIPLPR